MYHGLARCHLLASGFCARELDPDIDSNVGGAATYFADQYSKMFRDNFERLKANPPPHMPTER